jgi:4-amino-4-deoxy-L-arabinose transferase-like glycosyltransferase
MTESATTAAATPKMGRNAKLRWLVFGLGLVMGLLAVFVLWRTQNLVAHSDDPFQLAKAGASIARGEGLVQHYETSAGLAEHRARRGPFYPGLIAGIFLIGGENHLLIKLFQTLLAGGICVLIFEIGRRTFNERTGLIAACMYAVHPMVLRYVPDIQVEVVLTFMYTLSVFLALRFIEKPTLLNGALLGAAIAGAALTKAVALPFAGLFVGAYLLKQWLEKRKLGAPRRPTPWASLAAIFVAMACCILPWSYRNYKVIGHFVLISTNGAGEFLRGYIYTEPDYFLLRKGATTDAESRANQMEIDLFLAQGKVWEQYEGETDKVLSQAAKEKLKSEPLEFVRKFVVNFFMFWYVATTKLNSLMVLAMSLGAWALAFVGIKRARREKRQLWPLVVGILSVNLIYAAILALARYSAPVIPTLMVLAGFGVDTLLDRWQKRSAAPATAS